MHGRHLAQLCVWVSPTVTWHVLNVVCNTVQYIVTQKHQTLEVDKDTICLGSWLCKDQHSPASTGGDGLTTTAVRMHTLPVAQGPLFAGGSPPLSSITWTHMQYAQRQNSALMHEHREALGQACQGCLLVWCQAMGVS